MALDRLTTPQERLAAHRAAFKEGDMEALQPVIRAALATIQADPQAQAQAALRAAYAPLADDASDDTIARAEADAFHKLTRPVMGFRAERNGNPS